MHPTVLIIGGGLAGLTAAYYLHQTGISFRLIEARPRLGGRVFTSDASGNQTGNGFDLGPSWFWPDMHPTMGNLVDSLAIPTFPQNTAGDMIFQRNPNAAPQRYSGLQQQPESMRIAGGTGALISALASRLPNECIEPGKRVTEIALLKDTVSVDMVLSSGDTENARAPYVLLALPPRLAQSTIRFTPSHGADIASRWQETPTWMAPHAKFFALYDRAFWREMGLSGSAQSTVGPLVEIHDATTDDGQAALFGFVGIPADVRKKIDEPVLKAAVLQQLESLFGAEAASPRATLYKDWSSDPLTATPADMTAGHHPVADRRPWVGSVWQERLLMAGSETSPAAPGYLAGAIDAAMRSVNELIARLNNPQTPNDLSTGAG